MSYLLPAPAGHSLAGIAVALMAVSACGGSPPPAAAPAAATSPQVPASVPGGSAGTVVDRAREYADVDLPGCLAEAEADAGGGSCPDFIRTSAADALQTCKEVGGRLQAAEAAHLWAVDVNGDQQPELIYQLNDNFYCDGAASVFDCGSLGCPYGLYEQGQTGWTMIGALGATEAQGLEVLAPPAGSRYGPLRGGCLDAAGCGAITYFRWQGQGYEADAIDVGGHWVDFDRQLNGLWTLVKGAPVLKAPEAGAEVIENYPAGTDVALIGVARGAHYYYVSPCNACESGFIEPGALKKMF